MDLTNLINSGANLTLQLNLNDLKEFAKTVAGEINSNQSFSEEFLTRNEVAEKLGVTLPTLWRWNKIGYLNAFKIGSKTMYKSEDIRKILKK